VGAVGCSAEIMNMVTQNEFSISVAGTFSGNPVTLAAGYAMLGYLMENPQIYDELERKGNRVRSGFNDYMAAKDLPMCMTGIASFFETHAKRPPVKSARELLDQNTEVLYDMQLYLRLNGVHIAWLHDAFISAAHSDEDVDHVLRAHIQAAESALKLHNLA